MAYERKETNIEAAVRLELTRIKVSFVQEFPIRIGRRRWSYYVDFLIGDKFVIECDGDYWHDSKAQKGIDKRKDERLKKLGYKIVRLTETEIRADVKRAVKKAIDAFKS